MSRISIANTPAGAKAVEVTAVVTRRDGTKEPRRLMAYWDSDPEKHAEMQEKVWKGEDGSGR